MGITRRDFLTAGATVGFGALLGASATAIPAYAQGKPFGYVAGGLPEEGELPSLETMEANATGANRPMWTWETIPPEIPSDEIVETYECDILICGAGMAGIPASLYASENGAKTIVIEKSGSVENHRMGTAAFNARCQVAVGNVVDRDETIASLWHQTNGFQGRLDLYGKWFDNSGPYVDWLEGRMNKIGSQLISAPVSFATGSQTKFWQEFTTFIFFSDQDSGLLSANGGGFDWTQAIADMAAEQGAEYHFFTAGKRLIRDASSGRVTGLIAQNHAGEYVQYNASKGILLSTGDFAMNQEMLRCFNPSLLKCVHSMAEPCNVGDGHIMAMWIGADMDEYAGGDLFPFHTATNKVHIRPKVDENPFYTCFQGLTWRPAIACLPGALKVDSSGRRVANEDLPFQSYSIVNFTMRDGLVWGIFDSAWEEKFKDSGYQEYELFAINNAEEVAKEVEEGIILKFDTLDELIEGIGVDKETFDSCLNRYNKLCDDGYDADFLKSEKWMKKLDTPPYYAAQMGVSLTSTRAGLKIEEHCRVLDRDGLIIPGLYAAGNTAGSFYGHVYPPNAAGSGIGHGQCFGWLAVKDMLGIEAI